MKRHAGRLTLVLVLLAASSLLGALLALQAEALEASQHEGPWRLVP